MFWAVLQSDPYRMVYLTVLCTIGALFECCARLLRVRALVYRRALRWSKLRRYVPRALANAVVEGRVPVGDRELTVLFVDVRNYTTFAESHSPQQIFSEISRYTQRASEIIRKHGGWVADFSGDGLMAIFGCPRTLDGKEHAAVLAGLALSRAFEVTRGETAIREVGVGIATGRVYVGPISWRDQTVWSATGNATILAARLQAATRTLDASLAMDLTTHERAGLRCIKLSGVPVRGRERAEDVFIVPRAKLPRETRRMAG